jgi:hypothetical protein
MRTIILSIIMMLACVNNSSIYAQNIVREGNTFKSSSVRATHKADTLVTKYTFQDSKGVEYPIIVNKGSGACYVWKKSGKTGKYYRQYMKPEISQAVCKELNIKYTPKNKK